MSLINKMLKDLDKRSGEAQLSDAARASVRTVTLGHKKRGRPFLWIALLVLVALTAFAGWSYRDTFFKRAPAAVQPKPVRLASAAPVALATASSAPAPALAKAPSAPPVVTTPPQAALPEKKEATVPAPRVATVQANSPATVVHLVPATSRAKPVPTKVPAPVAKPKRVNASLPAVRSASAKSATIAAAPAQKVAAPLDVSATASRAVQPKKMTPEKPGILAVQDAKPVADQKTWNTHLQKNVAASTPSAPATLVAKAVPTKTLHDSAPPSAKEKMLVEVTPQQEVDNEYGKAVRLLEKGQRAEAMATLEGVLMKQYKHAPARQMLASLLVAEGRSYEAMNVLKAGLRIDSSQTEMAMLLARLQIDKGDNRAALSTLEQSLTYARTKPDYQAFIAAVYQREKRHKEAIEHYRAALGEVPGNGVWWMGYGISLQAAGRDADARTAFSQARDSGTLSPQLKAFVEQRLVQLSE